MSWWCFSIWVVSLIRVQWSEFVPRYDNEFNSRQVQCKRRSRTNHLFLRVVQRRWRMQKERNVNLLLRIRMKEWRSKQLKLIRLMSQRHRVMNGRQIRVVAGTFVIIVFIVRRHTFSNSNYFDFFGVRSRLFTSGLSGSEIWTLSQQNSFFSRV